MLLSLIYVSRSRLDLPAQAGEVDRIVTGSTERNAGLRVRGALIFTERHFAQILEGPDAAIAALMESITRDWRHDRVTVIEKRPVDCYHFPDWSLAYWGNASYMDGHISRILDKSDALGRELQTADLAALMQMLSRESRGRERPLGRPSPGSC